MSRPCAAIAASVKRSASAPYWSISSSGSMTLPFDFDILAPVLVAHERVNIDGRGTATSSSCMKCSAHHHHAGDPEEDDVEAGDRARWSDSSAPAPASSSGQPSVENGHSAEENQVSSTSSSRVSRFRPACSFPASASASSLRRVRSCATIVRCRAGGLQRLFLGLGDEDVAVRAVPGRDLVAPPELARNAPGLDVLHPLEIGLLPVLRNEAWSALAHRRDRRFRERLGVDIPLVGEARLDRHAAAVAMRHRMRDAARPCRASRPPP